MTSKIFFAESLEALRVLPDSSVDLITTDPPFNTGVIQQDNRSKISYLDRRDDYIEWMHDVVKECHRVLVPNGAMYIHLNEKVSYKIRFLVMDDIFGESNWLNTIIWDFDYGGRSKKTFARKHESVLYYAKNINDYTFHYDMIDRIPYMAPSLQKDIARREAGKPVTDVWWCTICTTRGKERVSYPNQKPLKLYERMIKVSSNPGDVILDPFAGSGTTCVAAARHGRRFIGIDRNEKAMHVMHDRFKIEGIEAVAWLDAQGNHVEIKESHNDTCEQSDE